MALIGQAANRLLVATMIRELCPDVILMDVNLPYVSSLTAIREIVLQTTTPIVVVSAVLDQTANNLVLEAINAGAAAVLQKPIGPNTPQYDVTVNTLLDVLRAASKGQVFQQAGMTIGPPLEGLPGFALRQAELFAGPEIVSMVASTGGPQVLAEILKNLPANFALPVVIVQHITADFVDSFVGWLRTQSRLPVDIASSDEHPEPGIVYVAPGGRHLELTNQHCFTLTDSPADVPHIPSGDVLLTSVARHYRSRAIGIVLTGMGTDGALGLRAMYDAGALTIAQDEASCVVFGMPQQAISLGAARHILPPLKIAHLLSTFTR